MTVDDIALEMTPGIGVKGIVHLLSIFGDARSVLAASADELIGRAQLRADLARELSRRNAYGAAEREMEHCRHHGIRPVAATDEEYPELLRDLPDRPHVLYIKGETAPLHRRCLSVVGTRKATPHGQSACERIVRGLGERVPGLTIVSGLAFGIDTAAHRAALASDIPTVAVLANALPGVTPPQHTRLAQEIVEKGGTLVTELHSQTRQNGNFYLARNRIIAGLSAGCVVVESADSGGSLVTAHQADGYDRTVMALPGRITDSASRGTNHLIRNRKAQMILSCDDIIAEMMWDLGPDAALPRRQPAAPQLTPDEEGLLGCFRNDDPLSADQLRARCGLDPGALATLLVGLELAGAVRQLPGNRYMKLI